MKGSMFLAAALLGFGTTSVYAQSSELAGICRRANTSANCKFTNDLPSRVVNISWLLAGSQVDYVDESEVNLTTGQSIELANRPGRDNCLFTEDTSVFVTLETGEVKAYHGRLLFAPNGQCSMILK